jgi:hypothetical protein
VAGDNRLAVITDRHRAGAHQLAELGQLLPFLTQRDGANRVDPCLARTLRLAHDESDGCLVVGNRVGVRHGTDRGEASGRGGHGAGGNGLDILLARLPQMDVEIDEAGRHNFVSGGDNQCIIR